MNVVLGIMSGSSRKMVDLARANSNLEEEVVQKPTEYRELRPVTFKELWKSNHLLIHDDTDNFHLSTDNNETCEFSPIISTDKQSTMSFFNHQLSTNNFQPTELIREDMEETCSSINNDFFFLPVVAGSSTSYNHDNPFDYSSNISLKDPNFTVNNRDISDSSYSDVPLTKVRKNIPKTLKAITSVDIQKVWS